MDIALCQVMHDAGLRRSEAAALTWADVVKSEDGSGRLTVVRSKTDKYGRGQVVAVTHRALRALEAIRPSGAAPGDSVFGLSASQIARRIQAAAKGAGLGDRFGGHSGRVGLAQDMTRAGAPAQVVQLQGRWSTAAMVARYSRGLDAGEALRFL